LILLALRLALRLLYYAAMTLGLAILLVSGAFLCAHGQQQAAVLPEEINVNARYTVEGIDISGTSESRMSKSLREDMHRLVGAKLNPEMLDDLARRIRDELHVSSVYRRVVRGAAPDHVRVLLYVAHRKTEFEAYVPKFVYQSAQGFSGRVEGSFTAEHNTVAVSLVSDGDELAERYTGITARFENGNLGTDRLRLRFQFASFQEDWNASTASAMNSADNQVGSLYRARQQFAPTLVFAIAKPLTLSAGTDFELLQGETSAARNQAANAATITLRYRRRLESSGPYEQDVDASYSLRAATRALASDYVYMRHRWDFTYLLARGRHHLTERILAGRLDGRAPLYEGYILGNSSLLRGWNKYDLDPLGADRLVYNSIEYRYGLVEAFYDCGAAWNRGEPAEVKHSLGLGLRKGVFSVAMAVPLRDGHFTPMLMVGMNY
jgi:outer membrane protein assembly factor BamA